MTSSAAESPDQPPTERRNPRSTHLDEMSAAEMLELMQAENRAALAAVDSVLPQLAEIAEDAAARLRRGGSIHYFGAGTSGRLGVLDASELTPTFNLEPGRVVAHIAGGAPALTEAIEGAEDSEQAGAAEAAQLAADDLAIGIAASGSTPYVRGALEASRAAGAATVLVSANPRAALAESADRHLLLDTGPEVLTGSTRLKAGTAQKLVLNGFSTTVMVLLGRTWQNLMVDVVAANEKLRQRSVRILAEAAEISGGQAHSLLGATDGRLKDALVMSLVGCSADRAAQLLQDHDGSVRAAAQDAGTRSASGSSA